MRIGFGEPKKNKNDERSSLLKIDNCSTNVMQIVPQFPGWNYFRTPLYRESIVKMTAEINLKQQDV